MSPRRLLVALALCAFAAGLAARAGAAPGPQEAAAPPAAVAPGGRLFAGGGALPVAAQARVGKGLPPITIRLLPPAGGAEPGGAGEPREIGRLEITRPGETTVHQTIAVHGSASSEQLAAASRLEDANFDGYADLVLASDGGGKGGGYQFYFYNPKTASFYQDGLAREMSSLLRGGELEIQRIIGGISLRQRAAGCPTGFVWLERFVVDGDHLVQVEEQQLLSAPGGCYSVQRRRNPDGAMVELSRYLVAENPS